MANELARNNQGLTGEVTANLADILERVLDKGIVITGDIVVQLADIDLLTIKIRLLITSVDRAKELGIDWWENDAFFSSRAERKKVEAKDIGKVIGEGQRKNRKKFRRK